MSLNKKVTKEVSIGEALTAKPIDTSLVVLLSYLVFEPSSPMYPTRPPSKNFLWSKSLVGSYEHRNCCLQTRDI